MRFRPVGLGRGPIAAHPRLGVSVAVRIRDAVALAMEAPAWTVAVLASLAVIASLLGWAAAPIQAGSSTDAADTGATAKAIGVALFDGAIAASAGETGYGCALTDTGVVLCWGNNLNHQLGSDGGPNVQPKPVAVPVGQATSLAVGGGPCMCSVGRRWGELLG